MSLTPPDYPQPQRRHYAVPGGTLSGVHFGRTQNPLKLVLLHANGFNGYAYKSLLEPMGIHAVALDLRGQGMSQDFALTPNKLKSFHPFAEDVSAFLKQHVKAPVLIAGHSLGGVVGMLAAQSTPKKVSGFIGFDPVTVPWGVRILPHLPGGSAFLKNGFDWAKKAGKRRSQFDSPDAAFDHYNGRGTFKFLSDEVVRDYLTGGMAANDDGAALTCHPLWEQAVYGAQAQNIYKAARNLPKNSHIIYAGKKPASTSGTRRKISRVLGKDKVSYYEDYSHFFPLIRPGVTRGYINAALSRASLGSG